MALQTNPAAKALSNTFSLIENYMRPRDLNLKTFSAGYSYYESRDPDVSAVRIVTNNNMHNNHCSNPHDVVDKFANLVAKCLKVKKLRIDNYFHCWIDLEVFAKNNPHLQVLFLSGKTASDKTLDILKKECRNITHFIAVPANICASPRDSLTDEGTSSFINQQLHLKNVRFSFYPALGTKTREAVSRTGCFFSIYNPDSERTKVLSPQPPSC